MLPLFSGILFLFSFSAAVSLERSVEKNDAGKPSLLFVTCVLYEDQVYDSLVLCESIRAFGGTLGRAPVRVYFAGLPADWDQKLKGPRPVFAWIKERFPAGTK
jgi:hypothetical protein